jgi:hypothetical protein
MKPAMMQATVPWPWRRTAAQPVGEDPTRAAHQQQDAGVCDPAQAHTPCRAPDSCHRRRARILPRSGPPRRTRSAARQATDVSAARMARSRPPTGLAQPGYSLPLLPARRRCPRLSGARESGQLRKRPQTQLQCAVDAIHEAPALGPRGERAARAPEGICAAKDRSRRRRGVAKPNKHPGESHCDGAEHRTDTCVVLAR